MHRGEPGFSERVANAGSRDALAEAGEEGWRQRERGNAETVRVRRRLGEPKRANFADGNTAGAVNTEIGEHRRHAIANTYGTRRANRKAAPAAATEIGINRE